MLQLHTCSMAQVFKAHWSSVNASPVLVRVARGLFVEDSILSTDFFPLISPQPRPGDKKARAALIHAHINNDWPGWFAAWAVITGGHIATLVGQDEWWRCCRCLVPQLFFCHGGQDSLAGFNLFTKMSN